MALTSCGKGWLVSPKGGGLCGHDSAPCVLHSQSRRPSAPRLECPTQANLNSGHELPKNTHASVAAVSVGQHCRIQLKLESLGRVGLVVKWAGQKRVQLLAGQSQAGSGFGWSKEVLTNKRQSNPFPLSMS